LSLSIDVVIPTHDHWHLTARCLSLLREQTVPHAVIVADNASSDDTPEKVRQAFPEVHVVELPGNLGFPAACNAAAAAGTGEIVVLLNNDVETSPHFLELLTRSFEDDPRVGSVAALLVRPGGRVVDSVGLTSDSTLAGFPRLRGSAVNEAESRRPLLSGPCGAGGAYRRTAWEEIGGLDEGVLFYGEDLDLALRLRSAGWTAAAAPDAVAVHLGSATFGPRSPWQRYQGGFSRGYFLRRYGLLRTGAAFRVLATESAVVLADAVLSRDLSAAKGRLAGWRSARGLPRRALPPPDAVESGIGFWESMRLRRVVYST
jgi:GT2 family glycosyltransferase